MLLVLRANLVVHKMLLVQCRALNVALVLISRHMAALGAMNVSRGASVMNADLLNVRNAKVVSTREVAVPKSAHFAQVIPFL